MLEAVVAVLGTVVGVAGMVTGYAGHRLSVRESARAASLARTAEERERELAREAERRSEVTQASLVQLVMRSEPSPLAEHWLSYRVQATNGSDQPIRDVTLCYEGRPLPTRLANGVLHAGESVSALLPSSDAHAPPQPALGAAEFTDAAGVRWRRSALGVLERQQVGGSWDTRPPAVAPFQPPGASYGTADPRSGPPAGTGAPPPNTAPPAQSGYSHSRLRSPRKPLPRWQSAAMVLFGALLVAWAVWSLSR